MSDIYEDMGGIIRRMREEQGMSKRKLAMLAECSEKSIRSWEQGKCLPDAYYLMKLADAFGCSIDALFGRKR